MLLLYWRAFEEYIEITMSLLYFKKKSTDNQSGFVVHVNILAPMKSQERAQQASNEKMCNACEPNSRHQLLKLKKNGFRRWGIEAYQ